MSAITWSSGEGSLWLYERLGVRIPRTSNKRKKKVRLKRKKRPKHSLNEGVPAPCTNIEFEINFQCKSLRQVEI